MADDQDDQTFYDPTEPKAPVREPPYRKTAPQSEYTGTQVAFGFVVMLIGLSVTFGIPLVLT